MAQTEGMIEEAPYSKPNLDKPKEIQNEHDVELAPTIPVTPAIDPVIEKRVLRKLDRRLPVLTGFMCTY